MGSGSGRRWGWGRVGGLGWFRGQGGCERRSEVRGGGQVRSVIGGSSGGGWSRGRGLVVSNVGARG